MHEPSASHSRPAFARPRRLRRRRRWGSPGPGACRRAGRRPRGRACGWRRPARGPRRARRGDAAEAEFTAPAVDHEALDPAAGAGWLDVEVQAIAVDVVPRRGGSETGPRRSSRPTAPHAGVLVLRPPAPPRMTVRSDGGPHPGADEPWTAASHHRIRALAPPARPARSPWDFGRVPVLSSNT